MRAQMIARARRLSCSLHFRLEQVRESVDCAQRRLQVVRDRIGEAFQLVVRALELGGALRHALLERRRQLAIARSLRRSSRWRPAAARSPATSSSVSCCDSFWIQASRAPRMIANRMNRPAAQAMTRGVSVAGAADRDEHHDDDEQRRHAWPKTELWRRLSAPTPADDTGPNRYQRTENAHDAQGRLGVVANRIEALAKDRRPRPATTPTTATTKPTRLTMTGTKRTRTIFTDEEPRRRRRPRARDAGRSRHRRGHSGCSSSSSGKPLHAFAGIMLLGAVLTVPFAISSWRHVVIATDLVATLLAVRQLPSLEFDLRDYVSEAVGYSLYRATGRFANERCWRPRGAAGVHDPGAHGDC